MGTKEYILITPNTKVSKQKPWPDVIYKLCIFIKKLKLNIMKKFTDAENQKVFLDIIYEHDIGATKMMDIIMYVLFQGELSVTELLIALKKKGNRKRYDIAIAELLILGYIGFREVEFDKDKRKVYFVTPLGFNKESEYEKSFEKARLSRTAMLNRTP